jgi:hypothetical protein
MTGFLEVGLFPSKYSSQKMQTFRRGLWHFVVKGSGILLRIIKADRYGHIISSFYFGGSYIFGSVYAMWMKIPPFNSVINLKAYERVVGLWNFVVIKGTGILFRLRIIKADRYGHIIYFGGSYIFGSVHVMWMKIPPFNSVKQFLWMVLVKCQHFIASFISVFQNI